MSSDENLPKQPKTSKKGVEVYKDGVLQPKTAYEIKFYDKYKRKAQRAALKALPSLEQMALNCANPIAKLGAIKELNNRALGEAQRHEKIQIDQKVEHVVTYADKLREFHQLLKAEPVPPSQPQIEQGKVIDAEVIPLPAERPSDSE